MYVYPYLAKLLMSGRLKFEVGKITFAGNSMTFIPLRTLKEMTVDAINSGKSEIMKLYFYGWHFGFIFTRDFMKTFKLRKFEETFRLIMDVASLIGYGDYQTLEFKQKRYSKFKNIENPFGLLFYPSKEKICHFVRGMNAGGGAALHEVLMNGIELECTANNKKYCLFMNVANNLLETNEFKKIAKEQLDVAWLEKKQLKMIEEYGEDSSKYLEYIS